MILRKIQEMGGATLLVSLPKDWANSSLLRKGSVVSIETSADGGLLIYPARESETKQEKEIEIRYPSKFSNERLPSEIIAAYLYGYDLITVRGQNRIAPKDRKQIIASIKNLIGLEVVEEDAFRITSQFLVDNRAVEPSKIFKRISTLVRAMITDGIGQFLAAEATQNASVAQRDDEVDRLHFLLVRLIRTAIREPRAAGQFGLSQIECLDFRVAANSLETAGDYAVELADSLPKLKSPDSSMSSLMLHSSELLDVLQDSATRSFLTRDFKLAQSAVKTHNELEGVLEEVRTIPESRVEGAVHFADIMERIGRCQRDIVDLVSPMSEIVLERKPKVSSGSK
jgi:phosphate uptake regulator